jgi:N utilization substance protein A
MSKELLLVVDAVANEKGVRAVSFSKQWRPRWRRRRRSAIRTRTCSCASRSTRVNGSYETFRRWEVSRRRHRDGIARSHDAPDGRRRREVEDVEVGDFIEEQVENAEFGRIAAQAAKQVIVQRVREAERAQVVDAYKDRVGELVTGVVKRVERGSIYVDLGGNAEAFIPKDKAIPRDVVRPGDRVRGYLFDVRAEPRGPQLFISAPRRNS